MLIRSWNTRGENVTGFNSNEPASPIVVHTQI